MTETIPASAPSTSQTSPASSDNVTKPLIDKKAKSGGKRNGRARQRRRGAADANSGSESEQDGGAESDGSLTSLSDGSDQSDDSGDSESEGEGEDKQDAGHGSGKALLADANSVPVVWNANSRTKAKADSGHAGAEVIQFGDTDAIEAAASGKPKGRGTVKSDKTAEGQKEAKPRRELSEAELAKLKEKREKRYAKMKEKKQATKAAKALQRQQEQGEAVSASGETSRVEKAGDEGSKAGAAAKSAERAADEVADVDAGSDGGWGPSDPTVAAGADSVAGGALDPLPSSTARAPDGDKAKGGKAKVKKGKKGGAEAGDASTQSAMTDSTSTAAGPSKPRNDKPPRGPRASIPAGDGWGGYDDAQAASTGASFGYETTHGGRGGRGGYAGGPGQAGRGRGGFRGGFAAGGGVMNGHMGMPIRGRGRGAYFSAFAPRYALQAQDEGAKDGRLEMDKIEDEERARRERARAAREAREAEEREAAEREAAAAASTAEAQAGEIGLANEESASAQQDSAVSASEGISAPAPAEAEGSKEDVEAEIDAFLASAAAALDISASKPPAQPKAAPAPPKSSVDGKWGHDAYEQQQAMDQFRSVNGSAGRGSGRGRGRGRGFGARGGFTPPVNGHMNGRPHQYASFSSPLANPSNPPAVPTTDAAHAQGGSSSAEQLLEASGPSGAVTVHLPGSGPSVQVPLVPLPNHNDNAALSASASQNATSPSSAAPNPLPPHLTGASHHSISSQMSNPSTSTPSQPLSRPGSAATPAFEPAHRSNLSQSGTSQSTARPLNRAHLALLHSQGIGATPTGEYYRLDSGMPVPPGYVQHLLQVNNQAQGHQRRSASGSGSRSASGSGSFVPRRPAGVDHTSSHGHGHGHGSNVYMPMQSPLYYPETGMDMMSPGLASTAAGADRPLSPFNPYAGTPNTPPLAMPMQVPVAMGMGMPGAAGAPAQQSLPGAGYFVPATTGRKVSIRAPGAGEGAVDDGQVKDDVRESAANDVPGDASESIGNADAESTSTRPADTPNPQPRQPQQHTFNPYANGYVPGQVQGPGAVPTQSYDMQAQLAMQMQMQHMQMAYPDQSQMSLGMGQMGHMDQQGQMGQMGQGYGWYEQAGYYQDNYGY